MTKAVAVLVSGSGSNLQALLDAAADPWFPADIVKVVSNRPDVYALERAARAGIPRVVVPHAGRSREDFERALLAELGGVDLVCLAGFMRVLGRTFLDAFPSRVVNVHPALLPSFPGLHGAAQARAHGVTQAGCTVHLVDAGVDSGPILVQASVPVKDDDTDEALAARILAMEHRCFPLALRWLCEDRVRVEGRRAFVDLRPGETRWLVG